MNQVLTTIEEPARGPAADEGVRPTIDADGRNWENYVALATVRTLTEIATRDWFTARILIFLFTRRLDGI